MPAAAAKDEFAIALASAVADDLPAGLHFVSLAAIIRDLYRMAIRIFKDNIAIYLDANIQSTSAVPNTSTYRGTNICRPVASVAQSKRVSPS